jgi:hypothetical protein
MRLIYFSEAGRMFFRRVMVSFQGIRRYDGDASAICRQVINSCFEGRKRYFMASSGHFSEFYCRDFGWSAESLIRLGFRKKVLETLEYALDRFRRHGKVEQTISRGGFPFTFPDAYSPDALAFLVHALRLAGDERIIAEYKDFLGEEVLRFFNLVVERRTGLVRRNVHFSSMKDYSVRSSSCYDNAITGMLSDDLDALGFYNPMKDYDYEAILKKYFWRKEYFLDDLSGSVSVCGDAQVFPFWTGVVKDAVLQKKALKSIQDAGLDSPFPLKYTSGRIEGQKMIPEEALAGSYERDAIWPHVGLLYIMLLARSDRRRAREHLNSYAQLILKHRNFLEVYDKDGEPFRTALYYSDECMIWAANFLALQKELVGGRFKRQE